MMLKVSSSFLGKTKVCFKVKIKIILNKVDTGLMNEKKFSMKSASVKKAKISFVGEKEKNALPCT